MKTKSMIKSIAVVLALFVATTVAAQSKADLKTAQKEAKTFAKEGWKVNTGYLSLAEQIALSKPILREQEKWVIGEARTTASYYDAARSNALMSAKVNIAKAVEEQMGGVEELLRGTQYEGQAPAISVGKHKEVAKSRFASEVNHPKMLMDCYRDLKNGNVEVLIRVAIPLDQAKNSYAKQLMKELDEMSKNQ